jgi:hypothetical protein
MTTTTTDHPSRIGYLLLVRLLIAADKGETTAKLRKDIEPLLAHRSSANAPEERISSALSELEASGRIVVIRGQRKTSIPKITLTMSGRREGLEFLGVASLPPRTTWSKLKKIYLPARAVGLAPSSDARIKAIASEPGFKAVVLKNQFSLAIRELPKLDEALDALAWKLIGFEDMTQKFDVRAIKTAIFNRELGDSRATDFKKAATNLLLRRVAARREDPKELRDAVLRRWIDGEQSSVADPPGEQLPSRAVPQPAELDLASFAARVLAAARTCRSGRFGDNKVFIAHVWSALQNDPAFPAIDLDSFKSRLAEANHSRFLDLSRADLVQAMNPDDVQQSELHYLNATFHFVRI